MKNVFIGSIFFIVSIHLLIGQNVNQYYQNTKFVRSNCLAVDGSELIVLGNLGKGLSRQFIGRLTPGVSMNFTYLKQINLNLPSGFIPYPMSMIIDSEDDAVVVGYLYNSADDAYLSYAFKFDFMTASIEWYVVFEAWSKFTDIVEYSSEADYIVSSQLIDGGATLEDASLFSLDRTTGAVGNIINVSGNTPIIAPINNTDFFTAIVSTPSKIYSGGGFSFAGVAGNFWPGMHTLDISTLSSADFDNYINSISGPDINLGNLFITDLATDNTSLYATIAGSQYNTENNKEFIVGKFQLDGQAVWINRYDFQQSGAFYSIKMLENDTIIVVGALESVSLNKLTEVVLMKIDGSTGSVIWTRKVDNDILWTDNITGNYNYKSGSVAIIDNMVYVAGYEKTTVTLNKASLLQLNTTTGLTQDEECIYYFNPSIEDITFSEFVDVYHNDDYPCTIQNPSYSISNLSLNRNLLCDLHMKEIQTSTGNIYFDNLQNNIIIPEKYVDANLKYQVFNLQGQLIIQGDILASHTQIQKQANGIFFIKISGSDFTKILWNIEIN